MPPQYNWNSVECGVKHHNYNAIFLSQSLRVMLTVSELHRITNEHGFPNEQLLNFFTEIIINQMLINSLKFEPWIIWKPKVKNHLLYVVLKFKFFFYILILIVNGPGLTSKFN